MTKKEIKDLAKALLESMNNTPLEMDLNINEQTLDLLSAKVVARFVQLREITEWHNKLHDRYSSHMTEIDWDYMDTTEEEDLLGELAQLMTLMNLFTDKEEYEKCSLLKTRIRDIKRKLKSFEA
jgi:hypothetical protein